METQPQTGLTYEDMVALPDDNLFRELIGGELIVTPSPTTSHQLAVAAIMFGLAKYAEEHGGVVLPSPMDVLISRRDVLQPDVLFFTAEHRDRIQDPYIGEPPDLVVEVSSPSTRKIEHLRKRDLYEGFGIREFWLVDQEARRVEVYRLSKDRFETPLLLGIDDVLTSPLMPGFELPLQPVLQPL